jgi:pimeloyl-ACP methyl ester carboxylesterase
MSLNLSSIIRFNLKSKRAFALLRTMLVSALMVLVVSVSSLSGQEAYTEESGILNDGTRYMMRMPSNWNGTLIRDLDFVTRSHDARYFDMLVRGFAVAGTARHERRWVGFYDPAREISHLDTVLDLFEERFRKPDRVIQYGCSGGGHVTLAVAEDFSKRIDGAVAFGAHTPMWFWNTMLDGWFVLKALLAPDLKIVDLPRDKGSLRPAYEPLVFAWRQAIDEAQKTPKGRARIALAVTIGQWPDWVNPTNQNPNREDVHELQLSMYRTVRQFTIDIGGLSRFMFESAAGVGLTQPSSNVGVDYAEFFKGGNESHRNAVNQLYAEAGLQLESDIETINSFARISSDPEALEYWSAPGRTVVGKPKIPVFRIHDVGDPVLPVSQVQGYDDQIQANGKEDLYRTAFTGAATHCGFTVAESAAAIEVMTRRLDTGTWTSTTPESLNVLAKELDGSSNSRFISFDEYKVDSYNRTWIPE